MAATTASVAYQIARELERDLEEYGIHDPDDFYSRYSSCVDSLNLRNHGSKSENSPISPEFTLFSDGKGPRQAWLALKAYREYWRNNSAMLESRTLSCGQENHDACLCKCTLDNPAEVFPNPSREASECKNLRRTDRACMNLMLKRMGQLLVLSCSNIQSYIPINTPLIEELASFLGIWEKVPDFGGWVGHPPAEACEARPLSLSFGLQMLIESYKSFGFSKKHDGPKDAQQQVKKTCRVRSLQFAADVSDRLA